MEMMKLLLAMVGMIGFVLLGVGIFFMIRMAEEDTCFRAEKGRSIATVGLFIILCVELWFFAWFLPRFPELV